MIALEQPLKIDSKEDQVGLVLWLDDAMCNDHYSFRATLSEIERFVGASAPASHELPAEYPMEDFVEGQFTWGGRVFSLYYERSLGYMQFSSSVPAHVEALRTALLPVTRVQPA